MGDRQVSREIFEAIMSEMVGTVRMNRGAGASGPLRSAPRSRPQQYGEDFQDGPMRVPRDIGRRPDSRRGAFTGPSRRDFESERPIGPVSEQRRSRSPLRDEEHYFTRRPGVDDFGHLRSREQEFHHPGQRMPSPLRSPEHMFGRSGPQRGDGGPFPPRGDGGPFPLRGDRERFPPRGDGGPFPPRGDGERFPPRGDGERFPPRGDGERFPPRGDGERFPPRGDGERFPPRGDGERFPPRGDGGPFPPRGEGERFSLRGDGPFSPRGDGGPFPPRGDGERFPPRGDGGRFPPHGDGERFLRGDGERFPPRGDGGPFPLMGDGGAFFPRVDGGPNLPRGRGGKFLQQRQEGNFPLRGRGGGTTFQGSARGRGASNVNLMSVGKTGTMDKKTKALMETSGKIATWAGFHRINANDYRRKNPAQSALDTSTAENTLITFKRSFPPELRSRCFFLIKLFNHPALKKTNIDKDFFNLLLEKNVVASPKDFREIINPVDQNLMSVQHYILKSAHPLFLACNTYEVNLRTGYYTPTNIFSSLKKTIFYCRQALVLFGQTYSLATYLRQSRILKALGVEEEAPKPADFPNLEDSFLFGSKYVTQLKTWLKKSSHQLKINTDLDTSKQKEDHVRQAKLKDSEVQGLKPADPKVLETVDKLLENAIEAWKERDTTEKAKAEEKPEKEKPDFWFLFDENSQEYKYYRLKLAELQKLKQTTTERMVQTDDKTPEELAAESKSMLYARKVKEVKKKIMKGVASSKQKKMGKTLTGALSAKKQTKGKTATSEDVDSEMVVQSENSSDAEPSGVDSKTRETIQNLARLIVEMGQDSKHFDMDSITSNPDFWFLKEEESEAHKYYQKKLAELRQNTAQLKAEPQEGEAKDQASGGEDECEDSKPALQDPEPEGSDDSGDEDDPQADEDQDNELETEEVPSQLLEAAESSASSTPTHSSQPRKRGRPVKASPVKTPKRGRVGELSKVEEPVTVAIEKPSGRPALRKKQAKQTEEEQVPGSEDEGVKAGAASGDEDSSATGQQSKQDATDAVTKEAGKRTRKKKAD